MGTCTVGRTSVDFVWLVGWALMRFGGFWNRWDARVEKESTKHLVSKSQSFGIRRSEIDYGSGL